MITWQTPPSTLSQNLTEYGRAALKAVQAVAVYWGQSVQDGSRKNAPWTDRTGNARSGLFFAVDGYGLGTVQGPVGSGAKELMSDVAVESGSDDTLIIVLSGTVFYSRFLETSNGGRYAIIMSTIEANLPQLERMLQELFR